MSDSHAHSHPITSAKTYTLVLFTLLVLTVVTVAASRVDFGEMNTIIALIIASVKATLVALFFMELRHDKFNAIIFAGGVFFLGIFLIFTLFDLDTLAPVLPSNLKEPVKEFPGAPLNKPIQPSSGAAPAGN